MRKLYSVPAAFACAALLLACNDDGPDPEPAPTPTLTLAAGEASVSSLSFTLTPSNAAQVAYATIPPGTAVPSAAELLSNGTAADTTSRAKVYTVSSLEAETTYTVAAAARNGEKYSPVVTAEMTTLPKDVPPPDKPTVELTAVAATASTLSFTVTPSADADKLAWMCIQWGGEIPDAGTLLAAGAQLDAAGEASVTAEGLQEQTRYVIAAVAAAGPLLSEVATLEMVTAQGEAPPWDVELDCPSADGGYLGNTITEGASGQYSLNLTNVEIVDGVLGPGLQFLFSFHSDLFEDPAEAAPAPGTYTLDPNDTFQPFTIDYRYSSFTETVSGGQVADVGKISVASLTIGKSGDDYNISALITVASIPGRKTYKLTYTGPVTWEDRTVAPAVNWDLEATYALATFHGTPDDNPNVHEWHFQFWDREDDPTRIMTVSCLTPAVADWRHPELPEGTFTVAADGEPSKPWVFHPGQRFYDILYGTFFQAQLQSYVAVLYCNDGTFTITKSGDGYTFDCAFTTTQNTRITTRYTGAYDLVANYYTGPIDRHLFVRFTGEKPNSSYFSNYGINSYTIYLVDHEFDIDGNPIQPLGSEYNMLALSLTSDNPTPPEYHIPNGTYTLSDADDPGTVSKKYLQATYWDKEGFKHSSKFSSGMVDVSGSDGTYDIRFMGVTQSGYNYECSYSGKLDIAIYMAAPAPYSRRATIPEPRRPGPRPDSRMVILQPGPGR